MTYGTATVDTVSDFPDFAAHCETACRMAWGNPTRETAKELRWTNGDAYSGKSFSRQKRAWYDHGAKVGGSTLDLVAHHKGEPVEKLAGARFFNAWNEAHRLGWVPEAPPEKNGRAKIRRTYPYLDENGNLLFEVVRFDTADKDQRFRQRRPNGNGGWEWNTKGVRRVLYRLSELIEAVACGKPVLVCEGEHDAETAVGLGYVATTPPEGAEKHWRDEYSATLRGADVVVVADNDARGQKHADNVARSLQGIADRVRVISFPVKDLSEWIAAGHTREELDALIGTAGDYVADEAPIVPEQEPTVIPIDLWGNFDPPELPRGLLPDVIEDFAFTQGEIMGCDPAGLAVGALVVCGAAIPDCIVVQVKKHDLKWCESARLWVALNGPPSTKKSPIIRTVSRPLVRMDGALARKYAAEMAEYNKLPSDERRKNDAPKKKRMRIEDTTIEAAQEILRDSVQGVLSLQDELSGWFGSMDKYNGGKGAQKDRGFWLQSWNGGEYVSDRVGRGQCYIPNLSVSLLGGIQPDPLRKIVNDTVDDGLIQRAIILMLQASAASKDEKGDGCVSQYESLVERLAGKNSFGSLHEATPMVIRFSLEAQVIRRRLEQRHIDLMACERVYPKLGAHIGKYDGIFARLCLIWHCIESRWTDEISESVALRVAKFLHEYLLPHAVSFYASLTQGEDVVADVAGFILAHKLNVVTNYELARGVRSTRNLSRHEATEIFEKLEALGWLTSVPGPRPTSPPKWEVNPECHKLFAARAEKEAASRKKVREMLGEVFAKVAADRKSTSE